MFQQGFLLLTIGVGLLIAPSLAQAAPYNASITASSTSCVLPCSGVTISWSVQGVEDVAYVRRGSETIGSGSSGAASPTINAGENVFLLHADGLENWSVSVSALAAAAPTPTITPTPVPAVPDYRTCNQPCGSSNAQCISGLVCHNGQCRLPSNLNDSGCTPPAVAGASTLPSPTATPKPSTGGPQSRSSILGAVLSTPSPAPEILGAESTQAATPSPVIRELPTPTPAGTFLGNFTSSPARILLTLVNGTLALLVVSLLLQILGVINIGFLNRILKKFTR